MPKYAARVDGNQSDIVEALRKIGCSVQSLAPMGKGVPDLLVGFRRENFLFEIKDGSKPQSARSLTSDEATWHQRWEGSVYVVNNVDEALRFIGALDMM